MNKQVTASKSKLSIIIDGMRFPLIYLVVAAHLLPFTYQEVVLPRTSDELYILISEMISHHIARIPVRCYFFVSGYYFFSKYNGHILELGRLQFKSKLKTLFLPFIAWNLLTILGVLIKNTLFVRAGFGTDPEFHDFSEMSIGDMFWLGPVNFPLWYLRDLMCMMLIFPLILYYIKVFKHVGVLFLGILYLANIESGIAGLSTTAIFFFSAGAYFAIFKKDMLKTFDKIKIPTIVFALLFLIMSLANNGQPDQEYYMRAFIITGAISLVNLFALLEKHDYLPRYLFGLGALTFFIYVIHEIYIINWLKGFFYKLPIYQNGWFKIFSFFIIPILCVIVCVFLFRLLNKIIPRFMAVILGNRSSFVKNV